MVVQLKKAAVAFLCLTVLLGVVYPVAITAVARAAFPERSSGSLVVKEGKVVGSRLLGQPFESPRYFWGRLSATSPFPYNAGSSTASNLGPSNPALTDAANARIKALLEADPSNTLPIPVDLVTASGSGLDPDISAAAAYYQLARVARARGKSEEAVRAVIDDALSRMPVAVFGAESVNVLELNLALDAAK